MNGSTHPTYAPHPDSTTGHQARDARVRAWKFVFECWHNKKGAHDVVTVTTSNRSNTGNGITNNETGDNQRGETSCSRI
jgi:hypothetical protein